MNVTLAYWLTFLKSILICLKLSTLDGSFFLIEQVSINSFIIFVSLNGSFFFSLFYFTILYSFCHTSTWICHRCTRVPNPEPLSHLSPHSISLDHPRAPAPRILYPASNLDWPFISYMILYMFQCHSPRSSHRLPLPQSP